MGFFCVDGFIGGPINYKSAYGTFRVKLVGIFWVHFKHKGFFGLLICASIHTSLLQTV